MTSTPSNTHLLSSQGVPLRLEVGPRDLASGQVLCVRRDTGDKASLPQASAGAAVGALLAEIQAAMLQKATQQLDENKVLVASWDEFVAQLERKKLLLAPFCGAPDCEDLIKKVKHLLQMYNIGIVKFSLQNRYASLTKWSA